MCDHPYRPCKQSTDTLGRGVSWLVKNITKKLVVLYFHHTCLIFLEKKLTFNLSECERMLKRMAPIGMSLEIELGVTGGEEDGVGSDDDIGADNPKLYTQPEDCLLISYYLL